MANIGQVRYRVKIKGVEHSSANVNIYADLIPQLGLEKMIKVGVQAPMGTTMHLNNREIMIGRTEMYETPVEVIVTSIYFSKRKVLGSTPDASGSYPIIKEEDIDNIIVDYLH